MQCHQLVDSQNKDKPRAVMVSALSGWQAWKGRTRFQLYCLPKQKISNIFSGHPARMIDPIIETNRRKKRIDVQSINRLSPGGETHLS